MKNTKISLDIKCWACDDQVYLEDGHFYRSLGGEVLCAKCGDGALHIHNWTQHDDYPYIEVDDFDGASYNGDPYKKMPL